MTIKVCYNGITTAHTAAGLAKAAVWVGLCTFNIDPRMQLFSVLPKGSQVIIGLPPNTTAAWEFGAYLKKNRPDLIVAGKIECHAKYGLFKMPKTRWLMLGSSNLTMGPFDESVMFYQNPPEALWDSIVKLHERLLKKANAIPAMNIREPLGKERLKALSSTPVVT